MAQELQEECISVFFGVRTYGRNIHDAEAEGNSDDSTANSFIGYSQNIETADVDMLSLSQLTIEKQEDMNIPHFFNLSPRKMPLSPHYVFEEEFSNNPWILLVATIFLAKTAGITARPFMKSFFKEFPSPYHVLEVNPASLERFFETLGLKKRGQMIWKMSYQFVSAKWKRASDLYGVGKYGEDAYRIFCLGHTDVEPNDRYLMLYVDWLRGCTDFLEEHGIVDCEHVIKDPVLKYYSLTLRELLRS